MRKLFAAEFLIYIQQIWAVLGTNLSDVDVHSKPNWCTDYWTGGWTLSTIYRCFDFFWTMTSSHSVLHVLHRDTNPIGTTSVSWLTLDSSQNTCLLHCRFCLICDNMLLFAICLSAIDHADIGWMLTSRGGNPPHLERLFTCGWKKKKRCFSQFLSHIAVVKLLWLSRWFDLFYHSDCIFFFSPKDDSICKSMTSLWSLLTSECLAVGGKTLTYWREQHDFAQ